MVIPGARDTRRAPSGKAVIRVVARTVKAPGARASAARLDHTPQQP